MSTGKGPAPEFIMNVAMSIVLTLITCGIYGIVWQYKQIQALNAFKGDNEYSFGAWFFLTIITCGIFGIYYEYKMANGINEIKSVRGRSCRHQSAIDLHAPFHLWPCHCVACDSAG